MVDDTVAVSSQPDRGRTDELRAIVRRANGSNGRCPSPARPVIAGCLLGNNGRPKDCYRHWVRCRLVDIDTLAD